MVARTEHMIFPITARKCSSLYSVEIRADKSICAAYAARIEDLTVDC
jgi:hypothetical protein